MTTTFLPSATPVSHIIIAKTENPIQNTGGDNQNSYPLPKAAFVGVLAVAVVSFLSLILCSGVITHAVIQREVGRRQHMRRRRREGQTHSGETRNLRGERRLWFAMRTNEAYEVTPYHSASDLGHVPSYLPAVYR